MIIEDCMRKSISLFWNNIYRENMDIGWSSLAIKSRLNERHQLGSLLVALTPGALTSLYDSHQIHMINGTQLVTIP